jgi:hypothetical protein
MEPDFQTHVFQMILGLIFESNAMSNSPIHCMLPNPIQVYNVFICSSENGPTYILVQCT